MVEVALANAFNLIDLIIAATILYCSIYNLLRSQMEAILFFSDMVNFKIF